MTRRRISIWATVTVVGIVFSACGADGGRRGGAAVAPPPAEPTRTHATSEGTGLATRIEHATVRVRNLTCIGVATGSGFLIDDRRIVTNRHVVDGTVELDVNLWDGRSVNAHVVGAFAGGDIAFAELDEPVAAPLTLATGERDDGELVTVVGFPGGGRFTTTDGSVLDRENIEGTAMYRISNRVRPGNSGGPLLTSSGEVTGIVTLLDEQSDEGLAIAIDELDRIEKTSLEHVDPCEYKFAE